jgi:GntR family transcriptional regulator
MGAISFRVDPVSPVPPYIQIANQVESALMLGLLGAGDQLPTVREVVQQAGINPNTVMKAYRHLELRGLTEARPGLGTHIRDSESIAVLAVKVRDIQKLRKELNQRILEKAQALGLSDSDVEALLQVAIMESRATE